MVCRIPTFVGTVILAALALPVLVADTGPARRTPGAELLPPLVRTATTAFEAPYAPDVFNNAAGLALSTEASVGYAVSSDRLFSVRLADGRVLDERSLASAGGGGPDSGRYDIAAVPRTALAPERLLAWSPFRPGGVQVWSLADPEHPTLDAVRMEGEIPRLVKALAGGDAALVAVVGGETVLLSLLDGSLSAALPTAIDLAAAESNEGEILALFGPSPQSGMRRVHTYLRRDAMPPEPLAAFDVGTSSTRFVLGSSGHLVTVPQSERVGGVVTRSFSIHDARTGEFHGTALSPAGAASAVLIDGAHPTLVAFGRDAVEFFDLSDPSHPVAVETLLLALAHPSLRDGLTWDPIVRVGPDGDLLYLAVQGESAVAVVDVDRRAEIGRLSLAPLVPTSVEAAAGNGGPRIAACAARQYGGEVLERGGVAELRFADLSNPLVPEPLGRFVRATPAHVTHLARVAPGAVVAVDIRRQAVTLVRARDGAVLDETGFGYPFVGNADYPALAAADGGFALHNREHLELFSTAGGRIRLLGAVDLEGGFLSDVFLHGDGSVLYRGARDGSSFYALRSRDGSTATLQGSGALVDRSPDGKRALAVEHSPGRGVCSLDLSRPGEIVEAWCRPERPLEARYIFDGARVLLSYLAGSSIVLAVADAASGENLGPESEPAGFWLYAGLGTLSEASDVHRAVRWRRVVASPFVETLLYDIDGGTPRLLSVGPARWGLDEIFYAPRFDGGWLEIHPDTVPDRTLVFLTGPDGNESQWEIAGETHRLPVSLGRGRLVTAAHVGADTNRALLSFWLESARLDLEEVRSRFGDTTGCP